MKTARDNNGRGRLYVVATPIGNLGDISPRALEALREADIIAAEDTRVSAALLNHFNIKARLGLVSYHKFNENARCAELVGLLNEGHTCAIITDAGTPCISDPGAILVGEAIGAGAEVIGIPGPCAAVLALSVSGFRVESYAFHGFLPRGNAIYDKLNIILHDSINTVVCYESPHRAGETLAAISKVFPGAEVCLCNDLTKRFELVYRGTPDAVLAMLEDNPNAHKGEYTLVFNKNRAADDDKPPEEGVSAEAMLVDAMVKGGLSLKEAIELCRASSGLPKKDVYAASLNLKKLFGK